MREKSADTDSLEKYVDMYPTFEKKNRSMTDQKILNKCTVCIFNHVSKNYVKCYDISTSSG